MSTPQGCDVIHIREMIMDKELWYLIETYIDIRLDYEFTRRYSYSNESKKNQLAKLRRCKQEIIDEIEIRLHNNLGKDA